MILEWNIHTPTGHLHEVRLCEVRMWIGIRRQADSGFNNIVIILTYTILKSRAVEGEKVLCSERLARDPHP